MSLEDVERVIASQHGVCDVHHTHIWSQDGEHHVMTTQVVPDETILLAEAKRIKDEIRAAVAPLGIRHATIEIQALGQCGCDANDRCR